MFDFNMYIHIKIKIQNFDLGNNEFPNTDILVDSIVPIEPDGYTGLKATLKKELNGLMTAKSQRYWSVSYETQRIHEEDMRPIYAAMKNFVNDLRGDELLK